MICWQECENYSCNFGNSRTRTGVCISHWYGLEIVGLASVLHISSLQVSILVLMDLYVLVQ